MSLRPQVILPEQQLLENSETWTAVLAYIPDANIRKDLHTAWSSSGKGRDSNDVNTARWNELLQSLPKIAQVRMSDTVDIALVPF